MQRAHEEPARAPAPSLAPGAAAAAPTRGGGIDTTRVLNLFGFVGPVASLMSHSLFPHGAPSPGGGAARGAAHIQRAAGIGGGEGRLKHLGGALSGNTTRFVLSHTEDAIDSVLPCAAERMFKRPGKFANADNLRFNYAS
jgi:hypothetical protein